MDRLGSVVNRDAEAFREESAEVLATMGLRLSPHKTLVTHIDEGLDFLGWHIQRRRKQLLHFGIEKFSMGKAGARVGV